MSIEEQIIALQNEIGPSNPVKGRKMKEVAIRFQKHFLMEQRFDSKQFTDWLETEPLLSGYATNHSMARDRLDAAGHRDDMAIPFEIVRVAKSQWKLRAPEELLLSGDVPKTVVKFLQELEREIIGSLQACDLNGKPLDLQKDLLMLYGRFKSVKEHWMLNAKEMQDVTNLLRDIRTPSLNE